MLTAVGSDSPPFPANEAPAISSEPLIEVIEGEKYGYLVEADDAPEDILKFLLSQYSDWLSIDEDTGPSGEEMIQRSAYALMALDYTGTTTESRSAVLLIMNNFGYNGLSGRLESDSKEYPEVTSKALITYQYFSQIRLPMAS